MSKFLLALSGLSAAVLGSGTGQAGCPCVGGNPNQLIPFESELYDQMYGTQCSRHDYGREYCGPGDAWCGKAWCYVEASCVAEREGNTYGAQHSVIFPGSGLMWSYETCGDENLFHGPWKHEFETVERHECSCTGSNEGLTGEIGESDVGKYCFAWDANNDYCKEGHDTWKKENDGWCPEEWCYVQENCWSRHEGVKRISRRSVYQNNPNVQLWYSYQNCGSPDNFPFTNSPWQYSFAQCANRPPVDVYFLVDSSDSVEGEWNGIREGVSAFIGGLDPEKGDRAGLILFGGTSRATDDDDVKTIHTLTSDIASLEETAKNMHRLIPGGTSNHHTWTYTAINHTLEAYKSDEMRPGNYPFLVLVTDGAPNPNHLENPCDPNINFAHPRSEILELGIKTLIFEIGEHFDTLDCLVDNPDEDVVVIPDANEFFDGIKENVFCNSLITDVPTGIPTPIPTTDSPTPVPTFPHTETTEECVMKCFAKAECTVKQGGGNDPLVLPTSAPSAPITPPSCACHGPNYAYRAGGVEYCFGNYAPPEGHCYKVRCGCHEHCFESPCTSSPREPIVSTPAPTFTVVDTTGPTRATVFDCDGVTKLGSKMEHDGMCRGFLKRRVECESSGCHYNHKKGKCKANAMVICEDLAVERCCQFPGCYVKDADNEEFARCGGSFSGFISF